MCVETFAYSVTARESNKVKVAFTSGTKVMLVFTPNAPEVMFTKKKLVLQVYPDFESLLIPSRPEKATVLLPVTATKQLP